MSTETVRFTPQYPFSKNKEVTPFVTGNVKQNTFLVARFCQALVFGIRKILFMIKDEVRHES